MKKNIDTIKSTRQYVLQLVKELSPEQLNEVPYGFNNNIIWNLAHLVAAQQGVCYLRAGQPLKIEEAFYLRYKPDTKPEGFITADEVVHIKALLFSTLDQFEQDYNANAFATYKPWKNRYGTELNTIDEAVQFLLFHEGLHVGYIMALKRTLKR